MISVARAFLFVLTAVLTATSAMADDYAEAVKTFRDTASTTEYFDNAYAYALFPTIGKGGIGIGGAHGSGRVYLSGTHVGDSTMTQLTLGLQLGGQTFSQIIFFEDEDAFKEFTSGNFEFSAQSTAVAITAGVSAEVSTGGGSAIGASSAPEDAIVATRGYHDGMAIFTIAKGGLMYEAALGGQKFSYDSL